MKKTLVFILLLLGSFASGFFGAKLIQDAKRGKTEKEIIKIKPKASTSKPIKIINILPLGYVHPEYIEIIKKSVSDFYGYECIVQGTVKLSDDILSPTKTRYDAEKILYKYRTKKHLLIITEKDITYENGNNPEWGVYGLGFWPGTTSVISTFRLKKNVSEARFHDRLRKISLHEIGHNLGLGHCDKHPNCMMNDSKGTILTVDSEKIWFCNECEKIMSILL